MSARGYLLVFSLLLQILPHSSEAQQKTIERTNQQWIQYYGHVKLSDKWALIPDGGFRWQDQFKEKGIYIARIGVGYELNQWLRGTAGLASTGAYSDVGLARFEIRPYQELYATHHSGRVGIHNRLRIEERFFKDIVNGDLVNDHDFNFRFRYQLSLSIPILKLDREKPDRLLFFNISDEIFINAGKEVVYNYLDKNRLVIGPSVQLNENLNIGLSYNFQFSQLNQVATYAHDDVLWLTVKHHMDVSRRE